MMKYTDIIKVAEQFHHSVNIEYDLQDFEKMKGYVPTSDSCNVLKIYLNSILGKTKDRATILVGPYGKGKSFLVLTLLQLVCFNNPYRDLLLEKIKLIDIELYELINEYHNKNMKLLPVIVDSNYYNVDQSFLLALNDSLKMAGLDDIVPNNVYKVCIELLNKWEKDNNLNKTVLKQCEELNEVSLKVLRKELESFDYEGYRHFETLYNCVTTGLKFNPMINTDIVKTYSDVINLLKSKGYSGIFIVYDEFSKTIDSDNEYLSKDLKLIQDFAERANRSSTDSQLNLCCITHKSLSLYEGTKKGKLLDSFRAVEGRFKELHFNRSLSQNYQIISFSLEKKNGFEKVFDDFYNENSNFYGLLKNMEMFESVNEDLLYKGCFPINPISVYAIIQLSEMVAQNERTMFTLIADNDENSLNSFITNYGEGLYNLDKIYDYFEKSFASDDGEVKNIWYRCQTALNHVSKNIHKKILKSLACIKMINDYSKLPATHETLALSIQESVESVKVAVDELIENKLLKISFGNTHIDFAFSKSKEIDQAIDTYSNSKKLGLTDSEFLDKIYKNRFYIPRKYNMEYQMTRFYKSQFINDHILMDLNSFDLLFDEHYDGLILNIINPSYSTEEIRNHFMSMDENENVIVRISKIHDSKIIDESKTIEVLKRIKNDEDFDDLIRSQVSLMIKENTKNVSKVLETMFKDQNVDVISKYKVDNFNKLLSEVFYEVYPLTPKINNEMINRHNVSSAYEKARNTILNEIIHRNECIGNYSSTGPEMTVYNSFFREDGNLAADSLKIVDLVKKYFNSSNKEKIAFVEIVELLKNKPYGIRTGLISMFLGIAISYMDDNMILYYDNSEIEINALNLDKIAQDPTKYYLLVDEKSKFQDKYLEDLICLFGGKFSNSYYMNLKIATELIKKHFINLPLLLKEVSEENNFLGLPKEYFAVRQLFLGFNINEYEVLIKKLPEIFGYDYEKTVKTLNDYMHLLSYVECYETQVINNIKNLFIENYKGSLNSCLKSWISNNEINYQHLILDGVDNLILNQLDRISYDDYEALNQLSEIIIGYRITDWTKDNSKELLETLDSFKSLLETSSDESTDNEELLNFKFKTVEVSPLGTSFMNNVDSIIDEYSDSISNEEKVYILMDLIKKISGGR